MTFGAADMMSVPWETVVKIYAKKLGSRRFDTLDQYAKDFLSFIEGATSLFPPEDQKDHVEGAVRAVWSGRYRDKLLERIGANAQTPEGDKIAALVDIVHGDHEIWEKKYSDLEGLGADYGARVVKAYESAIGHVEKQVFEGMITPNPEIGPAQNRELHVREGMVPPFRREWHRSRRNGRERALSCIVSLPRRHGRGRQVAVHKGGRGAGGFGRCSRRSIRPAGHH